MKSKSKLWLFSSCLLITGAFFIYSCTKKDAIVKETVYKQDESFFSRNNLFAEQFQKINTNLTNETFLNKTIADFKKYDLQNQLIEGIKEKFGKPLWDISIVLKNTNGLNTLITPLINASNNVTALIFFYQKDSLRTDFKIINRKTEQNKLPEYGNKEATKFTKASLAGLFNAADKFKNLSLDNVNGKQENGIATQSYNISWVCWQYVWSYSNPDGSVVVGATEIQCTYTITFDYACITIDLEGDTGGTLGGGGVSQTSLQDSIFNNFNDACLNSIWNKIFYSGFDTDISTLLINTFGLTDKINLKLIDVPNLKDNSGNDVIGHTQPPNKDPNTGRIIITLEINSTTNASKEAIAATIFHETLHAYLLSQNIYGRLLHENIIASQYILSIQDALLKNFPNLSTFQANALAWGGLVGTDAWNALDKLSQDNINKENGYQEAGINGTPKCQ